MTLLQKLLVPLAAVLLASCAAHKISTEPEYINSSEYQNKNQIKKSLFSGKNLPNDTDVQKILNSRLVLPQKTKIAVIKLKSDQTMIDSMYHWRSNSVTSKAFTLDEKLATDFVAQLKKSNRIQDVSILPNILIGEETNLEIFQIAAIRTQAEIFLVLKPENFVDYRYNILSPNQAKAYSTVEAILVSSKTGIIPFTSVVTESDVEIKEADDYSMDETIKRAKQKAESKAILKVASELAKFLNSIP